jgi:hypothetical protein
MGSLNCAAACAAVTMVVSSPAAAAIIAQGSGVVGASGWVPEMGIDEARGATYYLEFKTDGPVMLAGYRTINNHEYFVFREDGSLDYAQNNPSDGSGQLTYSNGVYSKYFSGAADSYTYWGNGNLQRHDHYTEWFTLDARLAPGTSYSYLIESVPEPSSWALMIAGFGLAGVGLRSAGRRRAVAA